MADSSSVGDRVFTFAFSHTSKELELLSHDTLYNFIKILCRKTCIGRNENHYEHVWEVKIGGNVFMMPRDMMLNEDSLNAKEFSLDSLNLRIGDKIDFHYDFGADLWYHIYLANMSTLGEEDPQSFPRQKRNSPPETYQEWNVENINLCNQFTTLNEWLFGASSSEVKINLFQPGRKLHYGFMERGNNGVSHMLYLPVKAGKDLGDYLRCFNHASLSRYSKGPQGYPNFTYFSVVVIPEECQFKRRLEKYGRDLRRGENEMIIVPNSEQPLLLNDLFPRMTALGGLKKSSLIPKGWITYEDNQLMICTGATKKLDFKPPPGLAFDGAEQYKPLDPGNIIFHVDMDISSLHQLFCVVEGLLATLS